jgi:serine kinase of HPr protein (carbohydrate metabolism regulator)
MILHAGLIALRERGSWRGVLIDGPSGSGKSDLALRALSEGFRLVADDRTLLFVSGGRLFGKPPGPLAGLIEVRGVGVLASEALAFAPIVLFVRCLTGDQTAERMPEPGFECLLGVNAPSLSLRPFEASAPAKIRRAMEALGGRP